MAARAAGPAARRVEAAGRQVGVAVVAAVDRAVVAAVDRAGVVVDRAGVVVDRGAAAGRAAGGA